MAVTFKRINSAIENALLTPVQSTPLTEGFYMSSDPASQSEATSPDLSHTWEEHENKKPADTDEDLELRQFMEDIKRYIRSIDIGNL
jgi:hypothetical protein